ncbi:hypothetical protein HJFPF1_01325 [Paramyrothecium foliicola]|nr:hypothetical protein HJFPF1_01325 [Paramyrothecium foliicola]
MLMLQYPRSAAIYEKLLQHGQLAVIPKDPQPLISISSPGGLTRFEVEVEVEAKVKVKVKAKVKANARIP